MKFRPLGLSADQNFAAGLGLEHEHEHDNEHDFRIGSNRGYRRFSNRRRGRGRRTRTIWTEVRLRLSGLAGTRLVSAKAFDKPVFAYTLLAWRTARGTRAGWLPPSFRNLSLFTKGRSLGVWLCSAGVSQSGASARNSCAIEQMTQASIGNKA
jgi:hypothetical protein